jgi:hypothetical protein
MTTIKTTVRHALRLIRSDLDGVSYLPGGGSRQYDCDDGTLLVRNVQASGGGVLLSVFEAELVGPVGQTIRKYKV